MSKTIILIPLTSNIELDRLTLNLAKSINDQNSKFSTSLLIQEKFTIEKHLSQGNLSTLLEEIIAVREEQYNNYQLVVVAGLQIHSDIPYAMDFNKQLATALNAKIIFVINDNVTIDNTILLEKYRTVAFPYLQANLNNILGYVVNHEAMQNCNEPKICEKNLAFLSTEVSCLGCLSVKDTQCTNNCSKIVIETLAKTQQENVITPPLFCYNLIQGAIKCKKRIVLPEGDEPRTIQASNICANRGLAKCVLLGEKDRIQQIAKDLGIELHSDIEIIEPQSIIEQYAEPLYEIRKNKGMTIEKAREQLQDNVVLGTMMLKLNEVDGLVSGAVHTTANTIRPAFQIIKTTPDIKIISSVFFICLPDQVLVYGDCAINPNPTAEELADIAIKSADSAQSFGIIPRVAMLSYSTGTSGVGVDVDRVKLATELAKQRRPDLAIEGPIQYDAAIDPSIAKLKMPNSKVAGHANVFIFPDLNSGNIGYKALQRATNATCIGPMLQGMRKPVNDLSRGCLVEDIVFTIVLTAIQAK